MEAFPQIKDRLILLVNKSRPVEISLMSNLKLSGAWMTLLTLPAGMLPEDEVARTAPV